MLGGDDLMEIGLDPDFLEDDGALADDGDDTPLILGQAETDPSASPGSASLLMGSVFAWSRQR
jgi:hypothetical protein